jgi:hypothetical protein
MATEHLEAVQTNDLVRKRLAKLMALRCFRNTRLEDLHAGTFPSSQSGDYTDVTVLSPYGEIRWQQLGRISDDEMRALMIDVVNHCYGFLMELFASGTGQQMIERLKLRDDLPRWKEPELPY